ncbi:type II toxin-antitoxin system RelE/ParE family toxin [Duganella vulcania]|nr:type II toxin-antitoxin system RelE/ParE family toxin [Duganella vulcania]
MLAYLLHPAKFQPVSVVLLSSGSHENFYTELKRLKSD